MRLSCGSQSVLCISSPLTATVTFFKQNKPREWWCHLQESYPQSLRPVHHSSVSYCYDVSLLEKNAAWCRSFHGSWLWMSGGLQPLVNGNSCRWWYERGGLCRVQNGGQLSVSVPAAWRIFPLTSQIRRQPGFERGNFHRHHWCHTSVQPITKIGQVQGAGSLCQSAYPNKTGVW